MKAVILAGGQGQRLWPLSRRRTPKQFLSLLGEQAMVVQCYERLANLFAPDDIYISCLDTFVPILRQLLPNVGPEQFIVEPARRDSGPAMAFVAMRLQRFGFGDEPVAFIPTDHAIADDEAFLRTLQAGLECVAEEGGFADIGVVPTAPLTTLGYTKIGKQLGERRGVSTYEFLGHVEKPDAAKAQQLVAEGSYLWHANYYMVTPQTLLDAYALYAPEIYHVIQAYEEGDQSWVEAFSRLKPVSMDFAVTEHLPAKAMRVLKADFAWSDVGQFAQLKEWLAAEKDDAGNVARAKHIHRGSSNCLVIGRPDKMIATIGLENVAIIDTGDALLVCDLNKAVDVKHIVEQIEEQGIESVL